MVFYKQKKGSPWINNFVEAERWLNAQENNKLTLDNIERPNTKWTFIKFSNIEVKAVIDNQPMLGTGPLPDWLRNLAHGRKMVSLDTYNDNICLWRCIAVFQGARPDRCTQLARELARGFFRKDTISRTSLNELDKVEKYLNKGKQFPEWLGIRAYAPVRQENNSINWHLSRNPSDKLKNIMTIGIYEGHAFLIKDITKLTKTYVCNDCGGRFTQACHLQRHNRTCRKGETEIICPEEKLNPPQTKYEMTFYDKFHSKVAVEWLEKTAKALKIHIHHAMCGHGGERYILGAPVDGFHPKTRTVFQFHGCWWHGCPCKPGGRRVIRNSKTRDQLYLDTIARTEALRKAGYRVIEKWECQYAKTNEPCLTKQKKSHPHAIFYDFESLHDATQRKEPTSDLTYEAAHVPISVSIGDTLEREPTHICDPDPKRLINRFMEELERRGKNIREAVRQEFMPDPNFINASQYKRLIEWCDQVPVLGFNSGRYDLNLIKEHFAELLADTTKKVFVPKKANTTMFIKTEKFLFLDIINYLGPGTSYDAWVKASDVRRRSHGCLTSG